MAKKLEKNVKSKKKEEKVTSHAHHQLDKSEKELEKHEQEIK